MSETVIDDEAANGFGFRLRFRTTKGLTTDRATLAFEFEGRQVTLASPDGKPLIEGGWYSLKAGGFATADEAEALGRRVTIALQIASIRRMLGVDVGEGAPTSALGRSIVESLAELGRFVRPNVHGLDVFKDRPGTAWFNASLQGTISTSPESILADLTSLAAAIGIEEPPRFDAVRLLNEALVSSDAAAQLVLAIAAVEMLAQGEDWTPEQKRVRGELEVIAASAQSLTEGERVELADAIARMHRLGIMEGFRRLLHRLGLQGMWPRWRDLYRNRSKLLHGIAYAPPGERSRMVVPAIQMAALVVLTAVDVDVPGAARALDPALASFAGQFDAAKATATG